MKRITIACCIAVIALSCSGGGGGGQTGVNDTTAPSVPMGLVATGVSSSQVGLTWGASTDDVAVAGYKVYRGGVYLTTVLTGTSTSDTGLSGNSQYCYSVSAIDAANNESGLSIQSCADTSPAAGSPSAPQNVAATSGVQSVTIQWDAVAGATSYHVYWSASPNVTNTTGTKIPNATSPYTHPNLAAGTYYYVVTAENAGGEGWESAEVSSPVNLIAFVTSVMGNGNLGSWADAGGQAGLAAGDAVCQARAIASNLTGTFKAWLSDSADDAYCRIHNLTGKKSANCGLAALPASAGPWVRRDGFPFGDRIDRMLDDGVVYAPIRYDETGTLVPNEFYFTNTSIDGALRSGYPTPCGDWTSDAAGSSAGGGITDHTTNNWTTYGSRSCSLAFRLACMQTDAGPALPAFAATGKKAFITSTMGNGNLSTWSGAGGNTGLAAGDAICQARATSAGLANAAAFKAWLSSSTTDAVSRIASDGPWVRLDGVRIANSKADLTDGQLFAPINVSQNGYYLGNYGVWTGSDETGTGSANNCSNWTSNLSTVTGVRGIAGNAGSGWSSGSSPACNNTIYRLYCLED